MSLSDTAREAVAEAFARARVPDLWSIPHEQEHYGRVIARYGEVRHPLRCVACYVHPETGALVQCVTADLGVPPISLMPTITRPTAQATAAQFLLHACPYRCAALSDADGHTTGLLVASVPEVVVHRLT